MFNKLIKHFVRQYVMTRREAIIQFVQNEEGDFPVPDERILERDYDLLYRPILSNLQEVLRDEEITDNPAVASKIMASLSKNILHNRDI